MFVVSLVICFERAPNVLQLRWTPLNLILLHLQMSCKGRTGAQWTKCTLYVCNKMSVDKQGTHLHPVSGRCHSLFHRRLGVASCSKFMNCLRTASTPKPLGDHQLGLTSTSFYSQASKIKILLSNIKLLIKNNMCMFNTIGFCTKICTLRSVVSSD